MILQVAQYGEKLALFEPQHREGEADSIGLARLYLPFKKEDQVFMVIGAEMSRKTPTARNHVSHILDKLGLSRRSEAAAFAVEHKLVPPREQHKDEM